MVANSLTLLPSRVSYPIWHWYILGNFFVSSPLIKTNLWLLWPLDSSGSDPLWLLRLGHQRLCSFCLVPLGHSFLEPWFLIYDAWLSWGHHAGREPESQGEATCRLAHRPSQVSPVFESSLPSEEASRWVHPTAVQSLPSRGPRCCGAGTRHPWHALFEFLIYTIPKQNKMSVVSAPLSFIVHKSDNSNHHYYCAPVRRDLSHA